MGKRLIGELELDRIYQRDCIEGMRMLPDDSVDLIITDPPYGIDYQSNWGRDGRRLKKIKNDDNLNWFDDFCKESFRVLNDNTALYCFTRFDVYPRMYQSLVSAGFIVKNLLVLQKGQKGGNGDLQAQYANDCELLIYANKGRRKFNKTNLVRTDGRKGASEYRTRLPNVWFDTSYNSFPKSTVNIVHQTGEVIHPTQKNVELIEWLLLISSDVDSIVLDSFMGSGTTAVAAARTGRKFIGFELEREYVELAHIRLDGEESN